MTAFNTITEMKAWGAARSLCQRVYAVTANGPITRDRAYCDQIRRAAVSVMSNIAEGFGRGTNADFLRFLDMAKGSATEVQSLLILAEDLHYLDEVRAAPIREDLQAVIGRISGLQRYLRPVLRRGARDASAERRTTNDERRTE